MEQEKAHAPRRNFSLSENDHDKIVGAVFKQETPDEKKGHSQNDRETSPRKKRPRIRSKVDY